MGERFWKTFCTSLGIPVKVVEFWTCCPKNTTKAVEGASRPDSSHLWPFFPVSPSVLWDQTSEVALFYLLLAF